MKRSDVIKIINETYSVDAEYLWNGETHAVFRLGLVTEDALKKLIDESWNLVKPKAKKRQEQS